MKPRKTMPRNDHPLVKASRDGMEFRRYCLSYGVVETDKSWDDPIDGTPVRRYTVLVNGLRAMILMKKGEVVRWGHGLIGDKMVLPPVINTADLEATIIKWWLSKKPFGQTIDEYLTLPSNWVSGTDKHMAELAAVLYRDQNPPKGNDHD